MINRTLEEWLRVVEGARTRDDVQAIVHELSPPPDLPLKDLEAIGTAVGKKFGAILEAGG